MPSVVLFPLGIAAATPTLPMNVVDGLSLFLEVTSGLRLIPTMLDDRCCHITVGTPAIRAYSLHNGFEVLLAQASDGGLNFVKASLNLKRGHCM